jgi:flagellar hook-associated protein 2
MTTSAAPVSSPAPQTQPVTTVASSNSSSGAAGGSVINVSSLVSQLVAATQAPRQSLIANQTQQVTTQISALGQLKGALSTFQSSLAALDSASAFQVETAASSAPSAFTATAASGVPPGTYNVSVSALASAQQLLSKPIGTLGTGTLSLSLGGASFSVTIGSTNDTPAGIAAAINSASGNPGITATVLQGSDGAHLLLSSSQTGAANTIQVTETDSGNGLTAVTYGTGNTGNYTQEAPAQDAAFAISGVSFTSPGNTVSTAMSGVTLTLLGTTASSGTPPTLTVSNDATRIGSNIQSFVTAYNTLQSTLAQLGGYDSSTGSAGPMMGNAVLAGIQNQIQRALYGVVKTGSATYDTLASIGVTANKDGSLSLNQSTLSAALNANFSSVSQLFSGTSGVAQSLNTDINTALGANGSITAAGKTLTSRENSLTDQSNQLQTQMTALAASLTQQYSALNSLLSSLQTTSAYLSQAFSTLPLVQGKQSA